MFKSAMYRTNLNLYLYSLIKMSTICIKSKICTKNNVIQRRQKKTELFLIDMPVKLFFSEKN